jgi:hypothetical protein
MTTYTLNGNGAGIGTNADDFRFLYMPTTGQCTIVARVVGCNSTATFARAGVMMRDGTNANAISLSTLFAPQTDWIHFYKRTTTGGNTLTQGVAAAALPYWIELVRGGITGTNYNICPWMSTNGTTWVRVGYGQQFTNWSDTNVLLCGLVVTSGSTNGALNATFDHVSIAGCSTSGVTWSDMHVGPSTGDNAASYGIPTYTISGGGTGIGTNADAFRFVYVPTTGSCTLVARVVSCSSTSPLARAGVMMRQSTNANDVSLSTLFAPQSNWVYFNSRTNTGGNTSTSGVSAAALPYWVKLVRNGSGGNVFSAYKSSNGTTWTLVGSLVTNSGWTATTSVLGGLAVTSGLTNDTLTATFDNMSITWP